VPQPGKLEYDLSAARANIKVSAKGYITTFTQETQLEWDAGEATLAQSEVRGLEGKVEITWAAFQVEDPSLDDDLTALQIPLELPIPFSVGPIPFVLHVKAAARIVPVLVGGQSSSGGSFVLTYNSDVGFTANSGSVSPLSKLESLAADLGATATVTAGHGPTGFAVGFEFPRLELAIGGIGPYAFLTLNQYADGQFTPGTLLTADIPPCQRASLTVTAIAGYKLSVLGFAELGDQTTLWQKKIDRFKDDKPCTLTGT